MMSHLSSPKKELSSRDLPRTYSWTVSESYKNEIGYITPPALQMFDPLSHIPRQHLFLAMCIRMAIDKLVPFTFLHEFSHCLAHSVVVYYL